MSVDPVELTIVIPALDEEDAIASIIERCQEASPRIVAETDVDAVRIVVVSDGSTDRTPEIAQSYEGIDVVVFPLNRGYGAAIKAGWEKGGGDLLAFLDADGTCDPNYFIPMCNAATRDGQDVVLGCRMGEGSEMPAIRRLGNTMYAILLGFLSRRRVRDTASGMRVIKRTALPRLYPLPDGLHFTPAMSARALMDERVAIHEVDMSYSERVGESKLHVLKDGVRFLRVILSTVAYVRVSRLTLPILAVLVLAALALIWSPATFYLEHARLEETMIYRILLSATLASLAVTTLCLTVVTEHVSALTLMKYRELRDSARGFFRVENLQRLAVVGTLLWLAVVVLNWTGVVEFVTTGEVEMHWSRAMIGAFATLNLAQLVGTLATLRIVEALSVRQPYVSEGWVDERRRQARSTSAAASSSQSVT